VLREVGTGAPPFVLMLIVDVASLGQYRPPLVREILLIQVLPGLPVASPKPRTASALRAGPLDDASRWLVSSNAGLFPPVRGW
jgi:hypothetical protein